MLLIDKDQALETLPDLLDCEPNHVAKAGEVIRPCLRSRTTDPMKKRIDLFGSTASFLALKRRDDLWLESARKLLRTALIAAGSALKILMIRSVLASLPSQ